MLLFGNFFNFGVHSNIKPETRLSSTVSCSTCMKMATRGRKKRVCVQQNTIQGYLRPPDDESATICRKIVNDLVGEVVCSPTEIVSAILDEVLSCVGKTKKHDGCKVGKGTIAEWQSKYPWLVVNDSKTNMKCSLCISMKSKLKLSSVWAHEGTPNVSWSPQFSRQ